MSERQKRKHRKKAKIPLNDKFSIRSNLLIIFFEVLIDTTVDVSNFNSRIPLERRKQRAIQRDQPNKRAVDEMAKLLFDVLLSI